MATAVTLLANAHGRPAPPPGAAARWKTVLLAALPLVAVALVATVGLPRLAHKVHPAQIVAALHALPAWRVAAAIGLTVISHVLMTFYDALGLKSLGQRVPWHVAARGAFTSYTLSHNFGLAAITGGSARLQLYGARGIPARTVARLVVVAGCAFWAGIVAVGGAGLALHPGALRIGGLVFAPLLGHALGIALFSGVAVFALLPIVAPGIARKLGRRIELPHPEVLPALIVIAAIDLVFACAALIVLIPGLGAGDFAQLYLIYAVALIVGLITHVPGGVGVFEAIVLAGLPVHGAPVVAAVVAYRAIYYLLPLAGALILNLVIEAGGISRRLAPATALVRGVGLEIAPLLTGTMTFCGGLVLLLSGALPSIHGRMHVLVGLLPLPFIEASHLAASLVGTALLLVAPALIARLESGMRVARLLFMLGAAFSLTKGLDIEEASVMLALAALLQVSAPAFYRRTAGAFSTHNRGWLAAAVVAVGVAVFSGFHAYRHLPYDSQLWWEFAMHGDAPRFLRASFATGVFLAFVALREVIHKPHSAPGINVLPPGVLARAVAGHGRSDAALALTGDKRFLVHPAGDAFLMFRQRGRTWVVMGDPVGPRERWSDLVWELRRQCDADFGRPCFYQASAALLPLLVELGLRPIKYGEEALVDAGAFTLAGPRMKSLRNSRARALREGLTLRVIPRGYVSQWLPLLRAVSDQWLGRQREKCFSLGRFEAAYLEQFDVALVVRQDAPDRVLAFANIWRSGDHRELSVDLMRQSAAAPPGTMDFLFTELIALANEQGYARFNLGLAPMSGVRGGKLAPMWARLVNLLFSAGRVGYNFRGLRHYKEKFAPSWEPRFIGLPSGPGGIGALFDTVALIHR